MGIAVVYGGGETAPAWMSILPINFSHFYSLNSFRFYVILFNILTTLDHMDVII
jgi:hypothetical protein